MSTLCSGKLLDKLRYLFSQLSDHNGYMMEERFAAFIRDIGRISSAVGEDRHPYDVSFNNAFCPLIQIKHNADVENFSGGKLGKFFRD